jgi:putative DNA primase/helicase
MATSPPPSIATLNKSADFWYYEIGVNVIPADTKHKTIFENWSQWKDKSMPIEVFESYKRSGLYNNGLAIIPGRIWRGPYEGKYLVAIDLDNEKAIEEFCRNNLERLKQTTLVEQTSNPNKMHIYFIVDREIPNKTSDKVDSLKSEKIKANEIPALEVKSNSKGIMFVANSPHQKDGHYQIIGTTKPHVFEAWGIQEQISIICDKYDIPYVFNNSNNSSGGGNYCNNYDYNFNIGPSIQELFSPGTKILEGHNRHLGILRVMDSLLIKNMGLLTLEQIKDLACQRNQELCVPPLDNKDIDELWKQSLDFANRKIKEREKATATAKQQKQNNNNNNKNTAAADGNSTTSSKTKLEKTDLIEEAVRLLIAKYRFATIRENKEILYYDETRGVYVKDGERLIEEEVDKIFGFDLRTSGINEIMKFIMRKTYVNLEEFDSNVYITNLENGLYNWETDEFSPHTPDYYSLNQIPVKYNPHARPKLFLKFLRQVLYQQDIRTAIEMIAYTFIRKNLFDYYFILIGIGANGKSVFIGILSNLHGLKNISNVSLKSLTNDNDRFALFDMVNKTVNVDTELSSASVKDVSTLKKLTGIQPMRVQQKGQPAFDAELFAKQIFSANEMPNISDNTDARYRREIPLSFPRQFEGKNQDRNLLKKIINNEDELSGIFNLVVNSLRVITKNNEIHVNAATIKERRAKAKLTQNPIKAFLEDALAKEPNDKDFETGDDLYDAFYRFCKYHKLHILGSDMFSEILGREYTHILKKDRKTIDKRKITIWKCKLVKWKNTDDSSQTTLAAGEDSDEDEDEESTKIEEQEETPEEKYKREQEEMEKWD